MLIAMMANTYQSVSNMCIKSQMVYEAYLTYNVKQNRQKASPNRDESYGQYAKH